MTSYFTGTPPHLSLCGRINARTNVALHRRFWPFQLLNWRERMTQDADRLLKEFGPAAYKVAADRSWREDVGLLKTHDPGHWSRVTLEIGRRLAIAEPSNELTPVVLQ